MAQHALVNPQTTRVGWIGLGVMGRWMCEHIMKKGFSMTVYSRTKAKAEPLLSLGATWASSPKEVANNSDVVCTMVGYPADVREVFLGEEGIVNGIDKPGAILIDLTTTEPSLAVEIGDAASGKGASFIDAPVSGGDVGAKNAALSIMMGGSNEAIEASRPILEAMGSNLVHQGKIGAGQHTKMCNQIVIATTMVGVCEALVYGHKAGLDLEVVLSSISKGAAGCFSLDKLAPRMLKRDFDPGFFVEHFIKDMGIALDEARRMNLSLPGLALAHQLYMSLNANGGGKNGTQALLLALERMNNTDLSKK